MTPNEHKPTREDVAKAEIGVTAIDAGPKWFLVAMFLAVIFSMPLTQLYRDFASPEGAGGASMGDGVIGGAARLAPTVSEFKTALRARSPIQFVRELGVINSRILRDIEDYQSELEDESFLAARAIPLVERVLIGTLGAGTESVYCGLDDWLFYRVGVDYVTGPGFLEPDILKRRSRDAKDWLKPPQPDPIRAIVEFRDALAERGIELVVAPAPTKAMIYPEKFSARFEDYEGALQNPSYGAFAQSMRENAIRLFDATPALLRAKSETSDPLFLETDTHWSPAGLNVFARELAAFIESEDILAPREPAGYSRTPIEAENLGDLAKMIVLPEGQTIYRPQSVTTHRVLTPDGSPWSPDASADVLLLGDSFTNVFSLPAMGWGTSSGLAEQMSYVLQRPIDSIALNDNGAFATRRELARRLRRGEDRLAGKKVVLFEFSIRELSFGDWKTGYDLRPPLPLEGATLERDTKPIAVTGRIGSITRPPRPGSVPYRDCIIAIHLTDLQATDLPSAPSGIVVFAWGMRDNRLEERTRKRVGESMTLDLVPWESVQSQFGSYNRVELEEDELLWLDLFWAVSDDEYPDREIAEALIPSGALISSSREQPLEESEPSPPGDLLPFLADLSEKAAALEAEGQTVWRGKEDWLFFGPELRTLTVGPFWGARASSVSRATNPDYADPLAAILDFDEQLASAGIDLLIVPVPAKATIYPEMISDELPPDDQSPRQRTDVYQKQFLDELTARGVDVLDLVPIFQTERSSSGAKLYCMQDTHWTSPACGLAARRIADAIRETAWFEQTPKREYQIESRDIQINGDLRRFLDDPDVEPETVRIDVVREDASGAPVQSWRESPVVLMGDSHCLVFHAGGDMHASGAGLPDHLAAQLGFPVDLVAVRGSGATPPRISLARRRDNLAGKRFVVWCFSVREFTEAAGGWRRIPVIGGPSD